MCACICSDYHCLRKDVLDETNDASVFFSNSRGSPLKLIQFVDEVARLSTPQAWPHIHCRINNRCWYRRSRTLHDAIEEESQHNSVFCRQCPRQVSTISDFHWKNCSGPLMWNAITSFEVDRWMVSSVAWTYSTKQSDVEIQVIKSLTRLLPDKINIVEQYVGKYFRQSSNTINTQRTESW